MKNFAMCFGCAEFKNLKTYGATQFCNDCAPETKEDAPIIKKSYKMRTESKKRAKEKKIYLSRRKGLLILNPKCEPNEEGCELESNQIHHKKGREGPLLNDQRFFLYTCGNCHRVIEDNPEWARNMGYSLSRTKTK